MGNRITIPRWFERHLHIRNGTIPGSMMHTVLPCTLAQRPTGGVLMGNHKPPNHTWNIANTMAYRQLVDSLLPEDSDFKPCMTCYLTDEIEPEEVVHGYMDRIWGAVKIYLTDKKGEGGTSNSSEGVRDLRGRYPVLSEMEKHGIPSLWHLEAPEADVDEFDREIVGLDRYLLPVRKAFPNLIIVIEHVCDGRVADYVAESSERTYATVTIQGLTLNRNDIFRGGLNPGKYCKPVAKREEHRRKVREHVTSGNIHFGAGTDSAPWDEEFKTKFSGCNAGIFTAPAAVEMYTSVFDEDDKLFDGNGQQLPYFGNFMSRNFVGIYGIEVSGEIMTLERGQTFVPKYVGKVRVHRGGETLPWRMVQ